MDPREKSPLHQPPDRRPADDGTSNDAPDAGASTQLDASQIVPDAPAKREREARRDDERSAEGGHLATRLTEDDAPDRAGIGDDEP